MNRSFDQEVIRTCLKDEVFQKQLLLHRLSFELHSLSPDSDMQIPTNSIPAIQTIKSSLNTLEEAFKQINPYLSDLNLQFMAQFHSNSMHLVAACFKTISQYYLAALNRKSDAPIPPPPEAPAATMSIKSQRKQSEYLDFVIQSIENKENQLHSDDISLKHSPLPERDHSSMMMFEKASLESIFPSQAVQQLEALTKQVHKMIENSEKMSDENYLFRHQELSNQMIKFKKPQELSDLLSFSLKTAGNEKIRQGFCRIVKIILENFRRGLREKVEEQIKLGAPTKINQETQVQDFKMKKDNQKGKVADDGEMLKNHKSKFDASHYARKLSEAQEALSISEAKAQTMQDLLRKKLIEAQQSSVEFTYQLSQRDHLVQSLKEKNETLKKEYLQLMQKSQKDGLQGDPITVGEKEQKKVLIAKKCLKELITGLQGNLKIKISTDEEFERDILQGSIDRKVSEIKKNIKQLESSGKDIKSGIGQGKEGLGESKDLVGETKQSQMLPHPSVSYQSIEVQTDPFKESKVRQMQRRGKSLIYESPAKERKSSRRLEPQRFGHQNNQRMEYLKQELSKRLSRPRVGKAMRTGAERSFQEYFHEPEPIVRDKKGPVFNRKDISFQEIKILRHSEICKQPFKSKRLELKGREMVLTEPAEVLPSSEARRNEIMMEKVGEEATKFFRYIENRNDSKDLFLKEFLKHVLKEVGAQKGRKTMSEVWPDQDHPLALTRNRFI